MNIKQSNNMSAKNDENNANIIKKGFAMNCYKFAATEWGFPGNGKQGPRLAALAGLDGLQLDFGNYEEGLSLAQKQVQDGYLDDQQRYGIEYPSIVLNEINRKYFIHGRDNEIGRISYEILEKAIRTAAYMNIPMVMVPLFLENEPKCEEEFVEAAKALQFCCDLGDELGIDITSESPMPYRQHLMLYEMVGRSNHWIFYDTQNYSWWKGADQMETLKALFPRMYMQQLHIKDGRGRVDNGGYISGSLLGKGDSECFAQIDFLKEHGYRGWYIFENFYNTSPLREENEENQLEIVKTDLCILKEQLGVKKRESACGG